MAGSLQPSFGQSSAVGTRANGVPEPEGGGWRAQGWLSAERSERSAQAQPMARVRVWPRCARAWCTRVRVCGRGVAVCAGPHGRVRLHAVPPPRRTSHPRVRLGPIGRVPPPAPSAELSSDLACAGRHGEPPSSQGSDSPMGAATSKATLARWWAAHGVECKCPSALPHMAPGLLPGPCPLLGCHAPPTWSAAASLLQCAVRRAARRRPVNEVDPLTLEPVRPGAHLFVLVSPHSHVPVAYDASVLRAYFEQTHTRVDPVTRRELDDVEMWRLAKATGGAPLVVLSARRAGAEQLEEVRLASERAFEACWSAAVYERDPRVVRVVALPRLRRALSDYHELDPSGCRVTACRCVRDALRGAADLTRPLPRRMDQLLELMDALPP